MFDARGRWRYSNTKLDDAIPPRDPHKATGHERQAIFPYVTGMESRNIRSMGGPTTISGALQWAAHRSSKRHH